MSKQRARKPRKESKPLPNRIRAIRLSKNWSQDDLAELVDCDPTQISFLETGERRLTLEWMKRLSTALGVKPAELINGFDDAPESDKKMGAVYRASLPLPEGEAVLSVPVSLSPESGMELKQWLDLVIKNMKRKFG